MIKATNTYYQCFSKPDKTNDNYRQELEAFIASTGGRGYYEFNVTSLRSGEYGWLSYEMLIRPINGKSCSSLPNSLKEFIRRVKWHTWDEYTSTAVKDTDMFTHDYNIKNGGGLIRTEL